MQLVYEFGAYEPDPVTRAIHLAVGNTQYSVKCMPNDSDTYEPTDDSLSSATSKLREGVITSFSLHPSSGPIRYVLVTCPFFAGHALSAYLGTIEYIGDDYRALWNLLLGVLGLSVVCLGFEEGVELDNSTLSIETFPWNQWPLVIGALRDQAGLQQWVIRHGPEMRWFAKAS
jgi:hypothetical protein